MGTFVPKGDHYDLPSHTLLGCVETARTDFVMGDHLPARRDLGQGSGDPPAG